MFKKLLDFKYKRKGFKEALGFYIGYFLLILITAMIGSAVFALVTDKSDFEGGLRLGALVAIIASLYLSFAILEGKKQLNNFGFVMLALLSGLLAYFGGALLGLIPAAYLSTK